METPDVLYVEEFLPQAEGFYETLKDTVLWDTRMGARKTATFGIAYNYSGMTYPNIPMHPLLVPIVEILEVRLGFRPNNCLANYYQTGRNTMGFHVDSTTELLPGTGIAIVSLGAERTLTFRRIDNKTIQVPYLLRSGSLLYMPPEVQGHWQHGLRRHEGAEGRISLTFRQVIA
jgi:alkylated DNA repair dioxygenase AlkB